MGLWPLDTRMGPYEVLKGLIRGLGSHASWSVVCFYLLQPAAFKDEKCIGNFSWVAVHEMSLPRDPRPSSEASEPPRTP